MASLGLGDKATTISLGLDDAGVSGGLDDGESKGLSAREKRRLKREKK